MRMEQLIPLLTSGIMAVAYLLWKQNNYVGVVPDLGLLDGDNNDIDRESHRDWEDRG